MRRVFFCFALSALLIACDSQGKLNYSWDFCETTLLIAIEKAAAAEPQMESYFKEVNEWGEKVYDEVQYHADLDDFRAKKRREIRQSLDTLATGSFFRKEIVTGTADELAASTLRDFLPAKEVHLDSIAPYLHLITDVYPYYAPEGYADLFHQALYASFLERWSHRSLSFFVPWDDFPETPAMPVEEEEEEQP